jgi:hypothetical protein
MLKSMLWMMSILAAPGLETGLAALGINPSPNHVTRTR